MIMVRCVVRIPVRDVKLARETGNALRIVSGYDRLKRFLNENHHPLLAKRAVEVDYDNPLLSDEFFAWAREHEAEAPIKIAAGLERCATKQGDVYVLVLRWTFRQERDATFFAFRWM